jgi:hypothetical protein
MPRCRKDPGARGPYRKLIPPDRTRPKREKQVSSVRKKLEGEDWVERGMCFGSLVSIMHS